MSLSYLIQSIKENGLMSVMPVKLRGTVRAACEMATIINDTKPAEKGLDYWVPALWLRRN